jgi:hypothetical protein
VRVTQDVGRQDNESNGKSRTFADSYLGKSVPYQWYFWLSIIIK